MASTRCYLQLRRLTGVSVRLQAAQQPLHSAAHVSHTQGLHLGRQLLLQEAGQVTRLQQVLHGLLLSLGLVSGRLCRF